MPLNLKHTKPPVLKATFGSGFKHDISSSHFQIIQWDANITQLFWGGGPVLGGGRQMAMFLSSFW